MTISGLSALLGPGGTYTLKALQGSDNATGFANVLIYQGADTSGALLTTLTNPTASATATELFGDSITSIPLTADTITLVGTGRVGDIRSTLSSVIVETVPEPASGLLIMMTGTWFFGLSRSRRPPQAQA